jgi:hypothetical protein
VTFEAALQAYLTGSPYPTALQNRWYRYKAPQGSSTSPNPYGVISRVSVDPLHAHSGPPSWVRRRVQLSVWSRSHETGADVADAVRRLLDGFVGTMGDVPVRQFLWTSDGYAFDEVTSQHHFHQDFRAEYIEA